jgi:hypothetical protein
MVGATSSRAFEALARRHRHREQILFIAPGTAQIPVTCSLLDRAALRRLR